MARKLPDRSCPVTDVFRLLSKAHMLEILYVFLAEADREPRRFVALQKSLKLSPNTLSERLAELVEAGLLTREAFNEIPPRVDYVATDKARSLTPIFATIDEWAAKNDLTSATPVAGRAKV